MLLDTWLRQAKLWVFLQELLSANAINRTYSSNKGFGVLINWIVVRERKFVVEHLRVHLCVVVRPERCLHCQTLLAGV